MKRMVLAVSTIIFLVFLISCGNDEIKYDSWKDTIESFGDGTYQVIHQIKDGKNIEILSNVKHNQCTITEIMEYRVVNNMVYFVGKYHSQNVCCILEPKTNLLRYYIDKSNNEEFIMIYLNNLLEDKQIELINSYDDFSDEEKYIFDSLNGK